MQFCGMSVYRNYDLSDLRIFSLPMPVIRRKEEIGVIVIANQHGDHADELTAAVVIFDALIHNGLTGFRYRKRNADRGSICLAA